MMMKTKKKTHQQPILCDVWNSIQETNIKRPSLSSRLNWLGFFLPLLFSITYKITANFLQIKSMTNVRFTLHAYRKINIFVKHKITWNENLIPLHNSPYFSYSYYLLFISKVFVLVFFFFILDRNLLYFYKLT